MAKGSRARRSQQILFVLVSLMVVMSMGLALFITPSTPVVPTATLAPMVFESPTFVLPLSTRTPTPVPTP